MSCPPPIAAFEKLETELSDFEKTKSALRILMSRPLPLDLISRMAALHAKLNRQREAQNGGKK